MNGSNAWTLRRHLWMGAAGALVVYLLGAAAVFALRERELADVRADFAAAAARIEADGIGGESERMALETLRARRRTQSRVSRLSLYALVLLSVAAWIAFGLYLAGLLGEPLGRLSRSARQARLGDAAPDWGPPSGVAEVDEVGEAIAKMWRENAGLYDAQVRLNDVQKGLMSAVNHEYANALTPLAVAALLLREGEPEPADPKRLELYRLLDASQKRLRLTSNNFLNLARLESGAFALQKSRVDLAALVRESAELYTLAAESRGIRLVLDLPEGEAAALADREGLGLVLSNLIGNALKYSPDGGEIRVMLARDGAQWRVEVRDQGIGIEPADFDKIFSGFYRTEAGKKKAGGFGVGLKISGEIVAQHGSKLAVDGAPGRGAAFSFSLPTAG